MFNVGGAEFLVIALVALLVLGPDKLPEAAWKAGNLMGELRRMSNGFRNEMQAAFNDPGEAAARERGRKLVEESRTLEAANPTPDLSAGAESTDAGSVDAGSADAGSADVTPSDDPSETSAE